MILRVYIKVKFLKVELQSFHLNEQEKHLKKYKYLKMI